MAWRGWACAIAILLSAGRLQAQEFASAAAIRAAVCSARGSCQIDLVLPAGRAGGSTLAVVRARSGRRVCVDEAGYRDFLVSNRGGVVRRVRELVRGLVPCLEWQRSSWEYSSGELILTYGGMGAPPAAGSDMRPTTLHLRPWPLAIISSYRGEDRDATPRALPGRGPIVVLSQE